MRPLHILFLGPPDLPAPPVLGGSVQIYMENVGKALAAAGHEVTLLSPARRSERWRHGVRCVGLGTGPGYLRRAVQAARRLRPDIVQVENRPSAVPTVRRSLPRIPVVLNLHSLNFLRPPVLGRRRAAFCLLKASATCVNSAYIRRALLWRHPEAADKVRVITPGVAAEAFVNRFSLEGGEIRERARRRFGLAPDDFVVLYAGRVVSGKGVDVALRALGPVLNLRRWRFWIVGPVRRPYLRRLRKVAASSGSARRVRFLGAAPPSKMPAYFLAADLAVCPSQKPEAFGLVNVEAAATGLPVFASNQGGIRESVIDGVTGRLVGRYRWPGAWRRELLAARRQELADLGRSAAREARARFKWESAAAEFASLYQSLINRQASQPLPAYRTLDGTE